MAMTMAYIISHSKRQKQHDVRAVKSINEDEACSAEAGIMFGPGNSPIALFQKESALLSVNSFLLYPIRSIRTKSQFSPDRVIDE